MSVYESKLLNKNEKLSTNNSVKIVTNLPSSVNNENDSENKGRILPQVLCTVAASIGHFNTGITNGWSANALPAISDDPHFEVGTLASSLIVGLVSLGALMGCLVAGRVFDRLGRRTTLMIVSPIMALGWGMIAMAPNLELIYAGRFISGFSSGFILAGGQIYSSETSESRIRGRLGSLPSLCLTVGILFCYIITGSFHWRTSAYISGGVSMMLLVGMFFAPESPYWLLMKNRNSEAQQILRKIRGPNFNTDVELKEMEDKLQSVGRNIKYSELLKSRTRYPFVMALFVMFCQQISGAQIIMMYTGTILRSANSSLDPKIGTIYTGVSQVAGFFVSLVMVDRIERKTLLATSLGSVAVLMIIIASYFLSIKIFDVPWPGWIPTAILMAVVFLYCLGCRSIPWIIASEVFNTSIRSRANSACVFFNRILNFCIVQVFPFFTAGAGVYTVLYLHGVLSIICSIAIVLIIPRTRGKSLEEIQVFFESKAADKKNKEQHSNIEVNNMEENKFL